MPRFTVFLLGLFSFHALQTFAQVPHTIQLQSRTARPGASLKRRALDPATVPLADFFKGTDLQWYGNISGGVQSPFSRFNTLGADVFLVGTPPQDLTVVFDTGSETLEFASTLCGIACPQKQFDSAKSSTFVDTGRSTSITFATGVGVDPVVGSNYKLTLRSGIDTVSVGGLTANSINLFLITNQTPAFNIDPFSGIQGMGATAQGFFAGLVEQGLPQLFSLYLTPNAIGNAELTLGGIDTTKFQGNLTYASLPAGSSTSWRLASSRISVNGRTTSILNIQRSIIFDSGTSNILFPTATAEAIYALISPDIKPNPAEPGTYGISCSLIPALPAVIDIAFTSQIGAPFNLTIPSGELSVGPFASNASLCQTLINAFDGLDLVGGSLLKHYYSVWDVGGRRIGFAPNGI